MSREVITGLIDPITAPSGVILARCPVPSHGRGLGDRNRSLQVRQGDKAWLLKCWSGCELHEITAAMGLRVKDLFFDGNLDPRQRLDALQRRAKDREAQRTADKAKGRSTDLLRHAEYLVQSARGMTIEAWTPAQLDKRLNRLADAYDVLREEHHDQR